MPSCDPGLGTGATREPPCLRCSYGPKYIILTVELSTPEIDFMTERKLAPTPSPTKLTEMVARDYPGLEIRVSFPEQWQLVDRFMRDDTPLYVAGMPPSQEQARGNKFYGLPAEINQSLTTYKLYKLFEPFVTPLYQVAWDVQQDYGQIIGKGGAHLHLQPIGQAQMWKGDDCGLLWESYLFETRLGGINWLEELALFWQAVEQDMKVDTIFTQPHEPAFQEGYSDFLRRLGYGPDPHIAGWWCKRR